MILVIDRKGTTVRYERETLCIERPDNDKQRVPLNMLEQVVVHGNPLIEASVWRALANRGIGATILPVRGQQEPATLGAGLASRLPLRRMQFACALDDEHSIVIARWFLQQKISAYSLPLQHNPALKNAEAAFAEQQNQALNQLEHSHSGSQLMGVEGAFASAWFSLIAGNIDSDWRFTGRNRRPPQDPLNALLSLCYTLLGGLVRQVMVSEGLDPAQGFVHQDVPGREAMVLDGIEPYRAAVDHACLQFLAQVEPDDFTYSEQDGCRLNKSARPLFYEFWANYCEQWPAVSSDDATKLRFSPVQAQLRGGIARLREQFKGLLNDGLA